MLRGKKWHELRAEAVREGRLDKRRVAAHKDRLLAAERGHRLAEIRREAGLSVDEVARHLQVIEDQALDIKRGRIDQLSISTLWACVSALAGELEVTATYGDVRFTLT